MKLLRYIQGLRKGKDAHRIEQEAMTDPFLADALEGFESVEENHAERIERMQRRLNHITQKQHHIAAAKIAAKERVLHSEIAEENTFCAEISADEEKEATKAKPHVSGKKKRRSPAVWMVAAMLLLFLATGSYFWLLKEETPVPQLALQTEKAHDATKEIAAEEKAEFLQEFTERNELTDSRTLAQDAQRETERRAEQQAVSVPTLSIPPPPAIESEIALADADKSILAEATYDTILDFDKLKSDDSISPDLLAFKDFNKPQPTDSIPVINIDELGIRSNTNRHALSQTEANKKEESVADYNVLSQSQIQTQGKISGKLSDQNQSSSYKRSKKQQSPVEDRAYSSSSFLPSGTVNGRVTDQYGEPLPGVTIVVKGTETATVTDIEGYFALNAKNAEKLVAKYIGFDSIELPADTTKPMTIAMNESTAMLDEVVINAYGVSRTDDYSVNEERTIPKPEIGYSAYRKYINDNLQKLTDECADVAGKVKLTFYVNSSGRPYNIQVKRSLCQSADQEAVRLVKDGGDWTIGDGEVEYTIKF